MLHLVDCIALKLDAMSAASRARDRLCGGLSSWPATLTQELQATPLDAQLQLP
jgi:hypothetical protein